MLSSIVILKGGGGVHLGQGFATTRGATRLKSEGSDADEFALAEVERTFDYWQAHFEHDGPISLRDRLAGAVWGHLVGDALGVPYEFDDPVPAEKVQLARKARGSQPPGTWSDDGALMLALLDSLLTVGFDTTDQARRSFVLVSRWHVRRGWGRVRRWRHDEHSPRAHRVGGLSRGFGADRRASCGNGSLMRILPLALVERDSRTPTLVNHAHRASRVTHGHHRAQVACALYVLICWRLLSGTTDRSVVLREESARLRRRYTLNRDPGYLAALGELEAWPGRGGRGYVLDSFWSAWDAFAGADSYEGPSSGQSPTVGTRTRRLRSPAAWPASIGASKGSRRTGVRRSVTRASSGRSSRPCARPTSPAIGST